MNMVNFSATNAKPLPCCRPFVRVLFTDGVWLGACVRPHFDCSLHHGVPQRGRKQVLWPKGL